MFKILVNVKVVSGFLYRPPFANASNQYITERLLSIPPGKATHKGFSTLSSAKNSTTGTMRHFSSSEYLKECPHWVTGFVDGEGSFMINIRKASDCKLG